MESWPFAAPVAALILLAGCGGGVYRPPAASQLDLAPEMEINDEDVRKAFEARPQMLPSFNVAYYSFDSSKAAPIEKLIRGLPQVKDVYSVPPLMVTGERRFSEASPWQPAKPMSVKKLRLLAARAHADVVMIFDYGYKVERPPNGLVAFGILLVPMLFVPMSDLVVESYLDVYVIDTRNGYLYGHLTADDKGEDSYLLMYSDRDQELLDAQWTKLLAGTQQRLSALIASEQRAPAAAAAGPGPAAPPAPSQTAPAEPAPPPKPQ
jgi:hypothetical protein